MACYTLGLSPDEFFRLTPFQFRLLVERHEHETRDLDYLVARLEATVANTSFAAPKQPLAPAAFMSTYKARKTRMGQSRKVIAQNLRSFLEDRIAEQQKAS